MSEVLRIELEKNLQVLGREEQMALSVFIPVHGAKLSFIFLLWVSTGQIQALGRCSRGKSEPALSSHQLSCLLTPLQVTWRRQ